MPLTHFEDNTPSPADEGLRCLLQNNVVDVTAGLSLIGGSEEIYINMMRVFTRQLPKHAESMAAFLSNGDISRFSIEIHSIKNSLASAGAGDLSRQAFEMETLSKAGDAESCRRLFPPFSERLSLLYNALAPSFLPAAALPVDPNDADGLSKRLGEIKNCLECFDYDAAMEMASELTEISRGARVDELLHDLVRQIGVFDFDAAYAVIDLVNAEP